MSTDERALTNSSFCQFLEEGRLMGCRCRSCGSLHVPPRPLCPDCHGEALEWVETSGRGELVAFTVIHIAPTSMIEAGYGRDNPYCAGVVRLEEGPSISAQILGVDGKRPERIAVGTPLKVTFIKRGEGEERETCLAFRA